MRPNPIALKKLNNEHGVIFITVLMIIIVLTVLTTTIISVNVGQVINTEAEYRRIQATELAKGAIAYHTAKQNSTAPYTDPYTNLSQTITDNGIPYTFNITVTETDDDNGVTTTCEGINDTNCLDIRTTY